MPVTSIKRDWGVEPAIVRLAVTEDLAALTTVGFLAAHADEIEALNAGPFEWAESDYVLVWYDNGTQWDFFTRDPLTDSLVAAPAAAGTLTDTLANGEIFVGNGANVATAVPMTGVVTITNAGVTSITNGAVVLADLAPGIAPSHVVKYAGQHTTTGGAAAEAFAIPGALATDLAFVQVVNNGTNNVTVLQAVVTANTLTVTFSGDPLADTVYNYQLLRVAA